MPLGARNDRQFRVPVTELLWSACPALANIERFAGMKVIALNSVLHPSLDTPMIAVLLAIAFPMSPPADKTVTAAEKKEFLELLAKLPAQGEFFTKDAITTAAPHTRVLFALSKKDIGKRDLYSFMALSAGLAERKTRRKYGVMHFGKIVHPEIKLFWAVVLFDRKAISPEVVRYLRSVLNSKKQSKVLAEMVGPGLDDFKRRVRNYKPKTK
jgi:hypothetical protein